MAQIYIFTMTSNEANRIVRKHRDLSTISWIGAADFEKAQMFKVDGEPEIILELAANLEIENVKHVGTMDVISRIEKVCPSCGDPMTIEEHPTQDSMYWECGFCDEMIPDSTPTMHSIDTIEEGKEYDLSDSVDPMFTPADLGDNIKIHMYFNDKYAFTTFSFTSKKEALKETRSIISDKELKIRAVLSNPGSDKRALKSKQG